MTEQSSPTLQAVLERREARAARQRELVEQRHMPLVSVTVVSPGPVKDSDVIRRVFAEAVAEVEQRIRDVELWPVWDREEFSGPTGPELLLSVDAFPGDLKRALAELEDGHPWGRLWDLDVIDESGPVGRERVGQPARRCLLCERPAPECARSRRHSVADMVAERDRILAGNPMD